jgi:hypothetical protein
MGNGRETKGRKQKEGEQQEGHAFTRATKSRAEGATALPKAGVEASADTTNYCPLLF